MTETNLITKLCTRCKKQQPTAHYESNKPEELYKTCIECRDKKNEYKRNHKEDVKLEQALYRYNHKDKIAAAKKLYRDNHKDKIAAAKKLYRENTKQTKDTSKQSSI
jgi:hypothetical protein